MYILNLVIWNRDKDYNFEHENMVQPLFWLGETIEVIFYRRTSIKADWMKPSKSTNINNPYFLGHSAHHLKKMIKNVQATFAIILD